MEIRSELPQDVAKIHELTAEAFSGMSYSSGTEPYIVDALRAEGALALSLVAVEAGVILGHVAFSPMQDASGKSDWCALGPVSILPSRQRQGIGSALIQEGLRRLKMLNLKGCALLGDVGYYGRFGFVRDAEVTLEGVPAEYSLICWMRESAGSEVLKFHEAFFRDYPKSNSSAN